MLASNVPLGVIRTSMTSSNYPSIPAATNASMRRTMAKWAAGHNGNLPSRLRDDARRAMSRVNNKSSPLKLRLQSPPSYATRSCWQKPWGIQGASTLINRAEQAVAKLQLLLDPYPTGFRLLNARTEAIDDSNSGFAFVRKIIIRRPTSGTRLEKDTCTPSKQ